MNQIILSGIQITISIWEMWMCYEILYMTVLDKKYADKKETIIRWANIFVVGSLLGINRLIAFFSRTMLGLVVILTIMCMYGIKRKKVVLSAGIVFVYFEFIAILDFILAFISMEFIKEQFEHVIYIYALTWQKVLIYFFTRGIILLGIVNIKKREESIRSMIEQCCGIIVITGALLCAVLFKYQLWLDEMANGSKPIRGINASMNLSAISLLIVLSGMFIIKYQVVKQEKTTLILRDQLLEERYAEMLKSRQMIHDMKNHLLVLRNMERANQWDKLHDYLEEISKDILDDSTKIWTGNGLQDIMNCEMNPIPQLEKKQMPTKIAELNWKTETDEIKLKKCVVAPITYMEQYKEEISSAAIHVEWKKKYLKNEEKTIQKIETYLYNSHDQSFRYRIYSPEIELRNNTIKVMTSLQAINKVALLFMAVFLTGMIAIYQLRFEHREESYGISLAYGAQYKELYWEIFCEILLLNSIGTIIGIVIGYLVTYYVDFGIMISVVNVQGSWYTFLSAYGLCVVLSSFVSVITFRKLKKKKIIELLNVY